MPTVSGRWRSRRLLRNSLRGGGCTFAEDPGKHASAARLLWSAAFAPGVLRAVELPFQPYGNGEACFDLTSAVASALVARGASGEHVTLAAGASAVRIDVLSGSICSGPAILEFRLKFGAVEFARQLAALVRLEVLVRGEGERLEPAPGDSRLARLILGLQVLDALRDGMSLRAMAEGLRLDAGQDWPGPGESVKSRIRRLVALARELDRAGPRGVLLGAI